jgi:hypothetical protein
MTTPTPTPAELGANAALRRSNRQTPVEVPAPVSRRRRRQKPVDVADVAEPVQDLPPTVDSETEDQ